MPDMIFERFLRNAAAEAEALAAQGDVLRVWREGRAPATFFCEFALPYLARETSGAVTRRDGPVRAVVHFPADYLRSTDPGLYMRVASVLTPDLTHPNVRPPVICLGAAFRPGTGLAVVLREMYSIFSFANFSLIETNSLNPEASRLVRAHHHLIDELSPPPLVRRPRNLRIRVNAC